MNKFSKAIVPFAFVLFIFSFVHCEGGEKCGPGMDPLTDMDSDCVENDSDNCPLIYNPDQGDGDDDGAGYFCDQDDTDETVGPSLVWIDRTLLDSATLWIDDVCYVVDNFNAPLEPAFNDKPTVSVLADLAVLCHVVTCNDLEVLMIDNPLCD